jgi:hypothetical protein
LGHGWAVSCFIRTLIYSLAFIKITVIEIAQYRI